MYRLALFFAFAILFVTSSAQTCSAYDSTPEDTCENAEDTATCGDGRVCQEVETDTFFCCPEATDDATTTGAETTTAAAGGATTTKKATVANSKLTM